MYGFQEQLNDENDLQNYQDEPIVAYWNEHIDDIHDQIGRAFIERNLPEGGIRNNFYLFWDLEEGEGPDDVYVDGNGYCVKCFWDQSELYKEYVEDFLGRMDGELISTRDKIRFKLICLYSSSVIAEITGWGACENLPANSPLERFFQIAIDISWLTGEEMDYRMVRLIHKYFTEEN